MTNHCQRDPEEEPRAKGQKTAPKAVVVSLPKPRRRKRRHTEEVEGEAEEAGPQHWLGPVADTVLVDFLFYGLFVSVPIMFLWILFGRWWIFQNFGWVVFSVGVWFVLLLGWRRKQAGGEDWSDD